jgi:hypothetical protein
MGLIHNANRPATQQKAPLLSETQSFLSFMVKQKEILTVRMNSQRRLKLPSFGPQEKPADTLSRQRLLSAGCILHVVDPFGAPSIFICFSRRGSRFDFSLDIIKKNTFGSFNRLRLPAE